MDIFVHLNRCSNYWSSCEILSFIQIDDNKIILSLCTIMDTVSDNPWCVIQWFLDACRLKMWPRKSLQGGQTLQSLPLRSRCIDIYPQELWCLRGVKNTSDAIRESLGFIFRHNLPLNCCRAVFIWMGVFNDALVYFWRCVLPHGSVDDLHDALVNALADVHKWRSAFSHLPQQETWGQSVRPRVT